METTKHQPIVQKLLDMIATNGWQDKFQQAFEKAKSLDVKEMDGINSLELTSIQHQINLSDLGN